MPHAQINGQKIYFEDTGGDGPPVILAHGFLMDHEMFAPQVAALRDEYRVITWDERGFGLTEYDGLPFSYWDSAADCVGLLDHLGIDRAVVGGMSQGGFLSLRVALSAPERVRGLILLDTQAGVDDAETKAANDAMNHVWLTEGPGRRDWPMSWRRSSSTTPSTALPGSRSGTHGPRRPSSIRTTV